MSDNSPIKPRVCLAGDQTQVEPCLAQRLQHLDLDVINPESISGHLQKSPGNTPLIILYYHQPANTSAVKEIRQFLDLPRPVSVIVVASKPSDDFIMAALGCSIYDFLPAPADTDLLIGKITEAVNASPGNIRPAALLTPGEVRMQRRLVGISPVMQAVKRQLALIGLSDATVLLTGETGTGKDLAGEYIHHSSPRNQEPFIVVNCASLPEGLVESELFGYEKGSFTGASTSFKGKFELASGGTLFLDEIGEMPLHLQAKLLHAIEKKCISPIGSRKSVAVNVKIIAATNQDIERMVKTGRFRIDLYYRLNVASVHLPPLREKKEDITPLVTHFLSSMCGHYNHGFTNYQEKDMVQLHRHNWPGNVRELRNVVEMSFIDLLGSNSNRLKLSQRTHTMIGSSPSHNSPDRSRLVSALIANNWNKTRTARELNWSRMTVHRKITKYNIVQYRNRSSD